MTQNYNDFTELTVFIDDLKDFDKERTNLSFSFIEDLFNDDDIEQLRPILNWFFISNWNVEIEEDKLIESEYKVIFNSELTLTYSNYYDVLVAVLEYCYEIDLQPYSENYE